MKKLRLITYTAALSALLLLLCGCRHVHSYVTGDEVRKATCTEEGIRKDVCECGDVSEVTIPTADHTGGEWQQISAPTCTEEGSERLVCTECDTVMEERAIPAIGHDLVLWEAQEPTCTRMGWNAFEICAVCDHSTYKSIPMTAHVPGEAATCNKPQTCTECGTVLAEAAGHTLLVEKGLGANCVREGKSDRISCSVCGLLIQESIPLPLAAHSIEEEDGVEPTCSETGLSAGEYCSFCNEVIVEQVELPTTAHTYSGIKDRDCDECGAVRDLVCEHSTTERTERVVASCANHGITAGNVCTYCGFVTKEPKLSEAKDHSFKKIEGFAPTATAPGLTDGIYCSSCKNIFKSQELIPPLGYNSPERYDGSFHEDYNGGKLSYALNPGGTTCTVVGIGDCSSPYIVIPTEIDGYTVTDIGSHAFWRESAICYVYISDSVTSIGEKAFSECPSLFLVELSDGTALSHKVFFGSNTADISFRHNTVYVQASKADCSVGAVKEHFLCQNCGGCFDDVAATRPIYEVKGATDHDFTNGKCVVCGIPRQSIKAIGVTSPEKISPVPVGTLVQSLGLPATVDVKTADRVIHKANVVWDTSAYNPLSAGLYTLQGYAELGEFSLAPGISNRVTLTVEVTDTAKEMLDVILLIDTTSSMADKLQEVGAGMGKLIDSLKGSGVIPRLGLIEFENTADNTKIVYNGTSLWYDSTAGFRSALTAVNADGNEMNGGSAPIDALMLAAEDMDARHDVKKVCIIISDGSCTIGNTHGFITLSQAVNVLNKNSVYTATIVPKRYPQSYESLLERQNSISSDIEDGIEKALQDTFAAWLLDIATN